MARCDSTQAHGAHGDCPGRRMNALPPETCGNTEPHESHEWYGDPATFRQTCPGVEMSESGYCGSEFAHMPHRFEGPPSKDEHGDVYREWIHCHGRRISAPPTEPANTDDNQEA